MDFKVKWLMRLKVSADGSFCLYERCKDSDGEEFWRIRYHTDDLEQLPVDWSLVAFPGDNSLYPLFLSRHIAVYNTLEAAAELLSSVGTRASVYWPHEEVRDKEFQAKLLALREFLAKV